VQTCFGCPLSSGPLQPNVSSRLWHTVQVAAVTVGHTDATVVIDLCITSRLIVPDILQRTHMHRLEIPPSGGDKLH
jgi:hypothetical protein